jgi:hypothetical protein
MPSRPARNRLIFVLAAMVSAVAPGLASRSGHEVSVFRPADHARSEPTPATPSSERADSSLDSLPPCPPPSEALLARRHTTWLGEGAVTGLIPAHSSWHHPWQGQAPDALLSIQQTVPLLPGPPMRILFCSWVV